MTDLPCHVIRQKDPKKPSRLTTLGAHTSWAKPEAQVQPWNDRKKPL